MLHRDGQDCEDILLRDRRALLKASFGLASALLISERARAGARRANFSAIAFDAFAVFDARPVAALCEALFPGKGGELASLWRARQFEYAWLRTLSHRYGEFE